MVAPFAHFPLSPGLSCQATPLTLLISHLCAHLVTVCVISTTKASACKLFFFLLFFFFHLPLTRNVYSHISAPAMAAGVSILSDLPYSMSGARSGEISTQMEMETGRRAPLHKNNTKQQLRHRPGELKWFDLEKMDYLFLFHVEEEIFLCEL